MLSSTANLNAVDPIRSSLSNGFSSNNGFGSNNALGSSHHIYEHPAQRDNDNIS